MEKAENLFNKTNEFKYCTFQVLTCTLVGGVLFPPHCKMDLYFGEGGRDSVHCGFYQDTKNVYLKVWCDTLLASAGLLFSQIW